MTVLRPSLLIGLIALALTSSGCLLHREIVAIQDHADKPVTLVETHDRYLFHRVDQFWQCADKPEALVCTKVCGPGLDLACGL